MASKFGLAGGIPERRVRPIWDAVDSRQFKTALKLSSALLTKYPSSPYALALKALILERMGKPDEAMSICLNAKELLYTSNMFQVDEITLNTMQIVFQRLDHLELATSCYEHACSKHPNNVEALMGLFNCFVREYSYVKQQQTAIKMYKIVAEERFLLWAVCSILLQVFCSRGGVKLLSLAEALLKKHVASHSLHEPEALAIYILILEEQGKYEAALEILSGNLGSLIGIEVEKLRLQGRLLARACDYAAAADTFQEVLELCPDDWASFLHYLGCLLEYDTSWFKACGTEQSNLQNLVDLQTSKLTRLTDDVFELRMSSALSFVERLQKDNQDISVRCPYLASVEIERQRRLKGKAGDDKLMEVLLNYFYRFNHLICFTSDVEMVLHVLTDHEKSVLVEKIQSTPKCFSTAPIKALGQVITSFKIQELVGAVFTLSIGELEKIAMQMVEMFCEHLPLSRDLDPQENMHGEELLCIACNVLVQLFWRTRYLGYLLEAIMVLEFGLTIRRYVWQYKILLLHLYTHLQALPLAYEWYGTLDVKNILLETVSHHILPQMLRSPLFQETTDHLTEYIKFMDDHLKEAADLTFLAYRHRNYSKVIEFVQFKERLQHSNQYLMARLECSILQLKQKADNLEEIESILEHSNYGTQSLELSNEEKLIKLTFNEDHQARPWWSPTPDVNYLSEPFDEGSVFPIPDLNKSKAGEEGNTRRIIERKSLLPRLVHLSTLTAASSLKEVVSLNGSVSETESSRELKILLDRYTKSNDLPFDDAVQVILGVSQGRKSFKDFKSDMIYWANFAVFINAWNLSSHRSRLFDGDGNSSWHVVDSVLEFFLMEQLACAHPISTSPGSILPVLVGLVTEPLSWHILVIQSCIRSVFPSSKRKKRVVAVDQPNIPQLLAIRSSIQCLSNALQSVLKWLGDQLASTEDESVDALFSHLHRNGEGGPGCVLEILDRASSSSSDVGERISHSLQSWASSSSSDVGERISHSLQSWSSANVARKTVAAQRKLQLELSQICDSKLKLLESLKQSIPG